MWLSPEKRELENSAYLRLTASEDLGESLVSETDPGRIRKKLAEIISNCETILQQMDDSANRHLLSQTHMMIGAAQVDLANVENDEATKTRLIKAGLDHCELAMSAALASGTSFLPAEVIAWSMVVSAKAFQNAQGEERLHIKELVSKRTQELARLFGKQFHDQQTGAETLFAAQTLLALCEPETDSAERTMMLQNAIKLGRKALRDLVSAGDWQASEEARETVARIQMTSGLKSYSQSDVMDMANFIKREFTRPGSSPDRATHVLGEFKFRDDTGLYWTVGGQSLRWYQYGEDRWNLSTSPPGNLEGPASLPMITLRPSTVPIQEPRSSEMPVPDDALEHLTRNVQTTRSSYRRGEISSTVAEDLIKQLFAVDKRGRFWTVGFRSGNWYYYKNGNWTRSQEPPKKDSLLTPDDARRYCGSCGQLVGGGEYCSNCGAKMASAPLQVALVDFLSHGVDRLPEPVSDTWNPPQGFPEKLSPPKVKSGGRKRGIAIALRSTAFILTLILGLAVSVAVPFVLAQLIPPVHPLVLAGAGFAITLLIGLGISRLRIQQRIQQHP
jgi:hypothetical protein